MRPNYSLASFITSVNVLVASLQFSEQYKVTLHDNYLRR